MDHEQQNADFSASEMIYKVPKELQATTILETISEGFIALDEQYRFTYVNAAAEKINRMPREQCLGRTNWEIFPETVGTIVERSFRRAMDERVAVEFENYFQPFDAWLHVKVYPCPEDGIIVYFRDITDEKRVIDALKLSEERFRIALLHSPILVYTNDLDLRYTWVHNPPEGFSVDSIVGKTDDELLSPKSAEVLTQLKRSVLENGKGLRQSLRLEIAGRDLFYDETLEPLHDQDGRIIGLTAAALDVTDLNTALTELQEKSERLAEADRRKDEFLAMLAHELRNPLSPIITASQVLRMHSGNNEKVARYSSTIERQVRHMARLLEDLLDVSRITQGKVVLKKEPVDLVTVVRSAVESTAQLRETKKQTLSLDLPGRQVAVRGDSVRLEQILSNLLHNAAKYTNPGGRIALALTHDENNAVISVKDTGIGIAKEQLPTIFELFTQAENTLDRSEGGLGIGLTLVRRLAELHDGTAKAESEGIGKGSTFSVTLPLLERPSDVQTEVAEGPKIIAVTAQRKLLVVDDNKDAAELLAELGAMWGYDVDLAFDGPQAVDKARAEHPDAVILDLGMPGMSGFEVAQEILKDPGNHHPKLLALSGYGDSATIERAQKAGFDQHLTKPVDPERLHSLLSTLLS